MDHGLGLILYVDVSHQKHLPLCPSDILGPYQEEGRKQ